MGPAVRMLLMTNQLLATQVVASGPRGTLLKGDVLQHLAKYGGYCSDLLTFELSLIESKDQGQAREWKLLLHQLLSRESASVSLRWNTKLAARCKRQLLTSTLQSSVISTSCPPSPPQVGKGRHLQREPECLLVRVEGSEKVRVGDIISRAFLLSLKANGVGEGKGVFSCIGPLSSPLTSSRTSGLCFPWR